MKKYIFAACVTICMLSCVEDKLETPEITDAGTLSMSFSYNGEERSDITVSSMNQTLTVDVNMSHDNVKWMVSSDSDWCMVDNEARYSGSSSFDIAVSANETFDSRENAVITLTAGEFTAFLSVSQAGNVFILDQTYAMAYKGASSVNLLVKVVEGTEWDMEYPEWLSAIKETPSTDNGITTTTVKVSWKENLDVTRYGTLGFIKNGDNGASAKYSIYQFGTDISHTTEGVAMLDATGAAPLEIIVPDNTFSDMVCPDWVLSEEVDNPDETTSFILTFADNPSDSESLRDTELYLQPLNGGAPQALPVISQNFYPAGGLLTAKGFKLFAERFNAGEDVSQWLKDGCVNVISNVDMTDMEGKWVSIGTEERPFNLAFDGGFRKISNFKSSAPLFGICDGAKIGNVLFDRSCSFIINQNFVTDCYLASLAGQIKNTTVADCTNEGEVKLAASADKDEAAAYICGLVCVADEKSTIADCANTGNVSVTADVLLPQNAETGNPVYVSGVIGEASGVVRNCSNSGIVIDDLKVRNTHLIGGVVAKAQHTSALSTLINSGAVSNSSERTADASRFIHLGGIVGELDGKLENSTNKGNVTCNSDCKELRIGGVVGRISGTSAVVSGNSNEGGNISSNKYGRYVTIGGLYGYIEESLTLESPVANCDIYSVMGEKDAENTKVGIGGLIGYANKQLSITSPKWSGNINYDFSVDKTSRLKLSGVGGVIGLVDNAQNLQISNAEVEGIITITTKDGNYVEGPYGFGGVAGFVTGGVNISNSTNSASIIACSVLSGKKSNGHVMSVGGIIGRVNGGVSEISNCKNIAPIYSLHYNNNDYSTDTCDNIGGIIGWFPAEGDNASIRLSSCRSEAEVAAYRGRVGGVAGALKNAEVHDCTFVGKCSNAKGTVNPYVGGITAMIDNTSIQNCVVNASMYGRQAGSCNFRAGGIAAIMRNSSKIENCSYFGNITTTPASNANPIFYGGIAGEVTSGCIVSSCKYGGNLLGVEITTGNFADYVVGDNEIVTPTDCKYWDGN